MDASIICTGVYWRQTGIPVVNIQVRRQGPALSICPNSAAERGPGRSGHGPAPVGHRRI